MTQGEPDAESPAAEPSAAEPSVAEPSAIVRNLGMIKAAAIIMGVLIIVLTAVVIGTIASRLAKMGAPPAEMSISLPQGVALRSASADGDGFVLVVETPDGTQIWRLAPDGARLRTIDVVAE